MIYEVLSASAVGEEKPTRMILEGTIDDENLADFSKYLIESGFVEKKPNVFALVMVSATSDENADPAESVTQYFIIREARNLLGSIRPGCFDRVYDPNWELSDYHMATPGIWVNDQLPYDLESSILVKEPEE